MRTDLAYFLIFLIVSALAAIVVTTMRYKRYVRRLARGHRHDKPVWKPFWLD